MSRYGCSTFLLDFIMTLLTAGFWIIWIVIREKRRKEANWVFMSGPSFTVPTGSNTPGPKYVTQADNSAVVNAPLPVMREPAVTKFCMSCGNSLAGAPGQVVECEYCMSKQAL
jgi:hypothetical protein